MSITIKEQVPAFSVSDLRLAIEFYSRMGFRIEWRWPKNEPTHVGLRLDRCALMLTLGESPGGGEIYYVVDDVRRWFEAMLERRPWEVALGAREASETVVPVPPSLRPPEAPEVRDHGHLDFTVSDPWGHRLTFGNEETQ